MIRPLVDPALIVIGTLVLLGLVVLGAATAGRAERSGWLLRGLMVLLLAAIALRPGWGKEPADVVPSDLEVVVYIDRTTSMSALDWRHDRPRLDGARHDVGKLMAALPSSRFTIATFGKDVHTELPSTSDAALVARTLSLVRPEKPFGGSGSKLDRPLEDLKATLERIGEQHPERRRVVILMSDGENTDMRRQHSFAVLDPLVDAGAVLGYGTTAGGLMPLDEKHPDDGWVIDPATGEPARSRIDTTNLHTVAGEMGVRFKHRTGPGGLADLAAGWQQRFSSEATAGEAEAKLELGWLLALALLVVAALDLRRHWRQLWQARRELA